MSETAARERDNTNVELAVFREWQRMVRRYRIRRHSWILAILLVCGIAATLLR